MTAVGLGAAMAFVALAVVATSLVGHAAANLLGTRLPEGARLPVGLAVVVMTLELLGFVLPVRLAVIALALPVAHGALLVFQEQRAAKQPLSSYLRGQAPTLFLVTLGVLLGSYPLLVAHRLAIAAITNDDATYYVDVADQLRDLPWTAFKPLPDGCLSNYAIHSWHWRTGIPNLIAAVSAVTTLPTTAALPIVRGLVYACIPAGAWWFTEIVPVPRTKVTMLIVGTSSALSGASLFLAWQDMTGQLAATALFPCAAAVLARLVSSAGSSRATAFLAALLLGAGVALFADGAPILLLVSVASLCTFLVPLRTALRRVITAWSMSGLLFVCTFGRAALALHATLRYRLPGGERIMPVRGWFWRSPLDDLGTLFGVDPWPPWRAVWPPGASAVVSLLGGLAATVAVIAVVHALRPRGYLRALLVLTGAAVVLVEFVSTTPYLISKVLLSASAFAVPLVAVVAALPTRRLGALLLVYGSAQMATLSQLGDASRFVVVDTQAHDRMLTELARLPRGSVVALDGFGAPSDIVHDGHRAYRAALRAGLFPIQPGLDGGFYKRVCKDPLDVSLRSGSAYALTRTTSETISRGDVLAHWAEFTLVEASASRPSDVAGAWAPVVGWRRAELEPGVGPFRWSRANSAVELRLVQSAPCATISGELRTVRDTIQVELTARGGEAPLRPIFTGVVTPVWREFTTEPIDASMAQHLNFVATPLPRGEFSDRARAFALRGVRVAPDTSCVTAIRVARPTVGVAVPELFDGARLEYLLAPAAGMQCVEVVALVTLPASARDEVAGRAGLEIGSVSRFEPAIFPRVTLRSGPLKLAALGDSAPKLTLLREVSVATEPWSVDEIRLEPRACP